MWNPPNAQEFNRRVYALVRQIPEGRVATYGQIAKLLDSPLDVDPEQYHRLGARWVGSAMRFSGGSKVPWQRVINSQGMISLPAGSSGAEQQRQLLEMEGVEFDDSGRIDLRKYQWQPELKGDT